MFKIGFNPTDLKRIEDKLKKLKDVTTNVNSGLLGNYKVSILLQYQSAIIRAMGSVQVVDYGNTSSFGSGFRGNVLIDFSPLGVRQAHWKNLSPGTIDHKRALGYRMTIWEASGASKNAVKLHKKDSFVGIDKNTDSEAWLHAWRTETGAGGQFEKRALFTLANEIFLSNKQRIVEDIRNIILKHVGWGT